MNELQFDVKIDIGSIHMDSEKMEEQLADSLLKYKEKEFTEDSKPEAKSDLAYLRDVKKQVNDRDREIKKMCMKPYDDFHAGVSRLVALIDEPISFIDGQVKKFEEQRILLRNNDIKAAYAEIVDESIIDYIPLECIYVEKWKNATTKMKSIRADLEAVVTKTKNDIAVISSMNSDAVEKAMNFYMGNRDLSCAIKYITDYEAKKAEILKNQEIKMKEQEEKDRQAERERIRKEERERIREEENIRLDAKREAVEEIKVVDEKEAAPLSSRESLNVIYTVVATPEEIVEIEMAMTSLGVYFERKDM